MTSLVLRTSAGPVAVHLFAGPGSTAGRVPGQAFVPPSLAPRLASVDRLAVPRALRPNSPSTAAPHALSAVEGCWLPFNAGTKTLSPSATTSISHVACHAKEPRIRAVACHAGTAEEGAPHDSNAVALAAAENEGPSDAALANGRPYKSLASAAVHAGERDGRPSVADALTTPVAMTSTYFFKDTADLIEFVEGRKASFEYGRYGNPTVDTVEKKISELEGAEASLLSASGMCAATTMLLAIVPEGGHIVTTTDCYRRTREFIQTMLPKMGITTTVLDPVDLEGLERALKKQQVSLYFSESPTNPLLRCVDVERVAAMCHEHGALVCIDGTFATPINQQAIPLGADLILHSATKYLAGHNDVLAGVVSGRRDLVSKVRQLHNVLGGVVDPHAAYLILRGMKTLEIRVQRQNDTSLRLARALEQHPKISVVHYPGLESHPEHHIAAKQMKGGFGGVVSFEVDGDFNTTSRFIDALRLPYMAPSLGGVESLVEQPAIASYWDCGPADRAKFGIKDSLIRYCAGIESFDDILADVMQALDKI